MNQSIPDALGSIIMRDDRTGVIHIITDTGQVIELPARVADQVVDLVMGA